MPPRRKNKKRLPEPVVRYDDRGRPRRFHSVKEANAARNNRCWEIQFAALLRYKWKFGDCNVPRHWEENQTLATWVRAQRTHYNKKDPRMSKERIERLNQVGFVWKLRPKIDRVELLRAYNTARSNQCWETQYAALLQYKSRFGDCKVPRSWEENQTLATWVRAQRTRYNQKNPRLTPERINHLNQAGFVWKLKSEPRAPKGEKGEVSRIHSSSMIRERNGQSTKKVSRVDAVGEKAEIEKMKKD